MNLQEPFPELFPPGQLPNINGTLGKCTLPPDAANCR